MEIEDMTIKSMNMKKGGFRASTFILVSTLLDNMVFIANITSMVLYFSTVMHLNLPTSANTLTNFMGSTFLLSFVGGFISDTILSKFTTCLIFGFFQVLGLALLTIQACRKDLQPTFCDETNCIKGGTAGMAMFYASLGLLAVGSGGVKGALPALGGDQFEQRDLKEANALAMFIKWLNLSTIFGACFGVTAIVYLSTEKHEWYWSFFISTMAIVIGFFVLALGSPFFRLHQPNPDDSPFIRIAQVIAAAIRNRRLALPESPDELYETYDMEIVYWEVVISHTNQFRWLDKAAIVPKSTETETRPRMVCTVTQVEEVKILIRILPVMGTTIIMHTCMAQLQTFSIQQANMMDGDFGKFKVPPASIPIIPIVFMIIPIPIFELVFVPFARNFTNLRPLANGQHLEQLYRVGVGLVLSAISMAVAGIVEVKRRNQAIRDITKPLSLFWLSFQYVIFGFADMFTVVGLVELFWEAPVRMRSLSTSFTWLSLSFGYFLSTVFVNIINSITKRVSPSKQGWLHGLNLNDNNLNLFYWFLAILSCLNFANYLYWASWYKYKMEDSNSDAKTMDLTSTTGLLLAEEESIVVDGAAGTNEAPSSVQKEDAKQ